MAKSSSENILASSIVLPAFLVILGLIYSSLFGELLLKRQEQLQSF